MTGSAAGSSPPPFPSHRHSLWACAAWLPWRGVAIVGGTRDRTHGAGGKKAPLPRTQREREGPAFRLSRGGLLSWQAGMASCLVLAAIVIRPQQAACRTPTKARILFPRQHLRLLTSPPRQPTHHPDCSHHEDHTLLRPDFARGMPFVRHPIPRTGKNDAAPLLL